MREGQRETKRERERKREIKRDKERKRESIKNKSYPNLYIPNGLKGKVKYNGVFISPFPSSFPR